MRTTQLSRCHVDRSETSLDDLSDLTVGEQSEILRFAQNDNR
jgi:hypothetical protein